MGGASSAHLLLTVLLRAAMVAAAGWPAANQINISFCPRQDVTDMAVAGIERPRAGTGTERER